MQQNQFGCKQHLAEDGKVGFLYSSVRIAELQDLTVVFVLLIQGCITVRETAELHNED